jgi:hypothetical protein
VKKSEKVNIIIQTFLVKIISDEWTDVSESEMYHICQHADCNKISDRVIANNETLQKVIPWEKIDRMKIIRLITRNVNIINFLELSEYNFSIKEVNYSPISFAVGG